MRNPYISFLQAFGILLVAVGHAFPTDGHDAGLYRWIYSFHMPLWIFLSGYLLRKLFLYFFISRYLFLYI